MMVCNPKISPLSRSAELTACSPRAGEDQVDTPMPVHSHRPRCAIISLFIFCSEPNVLPPYPLLESCLLHWIQSSQENQARVEKAYKCPQCGADYEIESNNPAVLRLLNKLNKILTSTGKIATVVGMGTTVFTFGTCASAPSESTGCALNLTDLPIGNTGIYLMCTSYGAWAVREFLGQEM